MILRPLTPVGLSETLVVPMYATVHAGFASPAEDYMEPDINLQEMLVPRPLSTFLIRVQGESMIGANMPDGCLLVVDKSLKARSGDIIVALVYNEFTVKRLVETSRNWILHPENPLFKPVIIVPEMEFKVWGVVTKIIIDPK
jgi:DNA polymerase V